MSCMRRIWLSKIEWQLVVVLGVLVIVTWINFPKNTYLTGWDNLHPEFDFGLNFWRALSGVWVGNEGVGSALGHGFAASLPHTLFLWVASLVVPTMYLRSGFTFLMYFVGVVGVYKLVRRIFGKDRFAPWGAMIGAMYYGLNLGMVQTFFAPLESFVVMYGLLPWVILTISNYLNIPSKKNLLIVFGVQILFSVIGFIPPLFVAYGFVLVGMMLGHLWKGRREFGKNLSKILLMGIVILIAHLYWLMPVVRYSLFGSQAYVEAKNNELSTPDFQYMSEARGKVTDTMILRGFFIDSSDSVLEGETKFYPIFEAWNEYLPRVEWVGYALFGLIVLGIFGSLIHGGEASVAGGVIAGFVVGFMVLTQGEKIFANVVYLVRDVPMLGQAFRAAWTKFSGILMLPYSLFLAYGVWVLSMWKEWIKYVFVPVVVGGIICFGWPIFQGKFIYQRLKVNPPIEYFNLFKFMKTQNVSARIVVLPMAWNWGWGANKWGYSGSGFLWYGIKQPILDRAFDVWSPYNETFYQEFSNAIYSCPTRSHLVGDWEVCEEQVASVLQKYDVRYVLLDESVIAPGQDKEILRIEETKKLAEVLGWEEKFKEGFLTVWETESQSSDLSLTQGSELGLTVPERYTWVEADTEKVRRDVVWEGVGHYVSVVTQKYSDTVSQTVYPLAGLMREELKGIEYGEDKITVSSDHLPAQGSELLVPGWKAGEIVRVEFRDGKAVPAYRINGQDGPRFLGKERPRVGENYMVARVSKGEEWREYLEERKYPLQGETLKVEVVGEPTVYDFGKDGQETVGNCDVLKRGIAAKSQLTRSDLQQHVTAYTADGRGAACDYVVMTELDTRLPYFMRVQGENKEGRSLKFFLYNTGSKRNDLEWLMSEGVFDQTFALLPWSWDGYYTLNIETRSFGQRAENTIGPVEARWFPLEQIAGAKIIPSRSDLVGSENDLHPTRSDLRVINVKKMGTWLYRVEVEGQGLLRLSQGYDNGWISIGLPHVKVDGWANGWMVPESGTVTIFYWPQLLEYLGFVMIGGLVIWVWRVKKFE